VDPAAYHQLRAIFERVVDLSSAERAAELHRLELDTGLRERLLQLLVAADGSGLEPAEPIPDTIAGFRVLRELGRGGMGVVYEAQQSAPRRRVALKTLPRHLDTPERRRLLRREVQAMAEVRHAGIPQVHGVVEHDSRPVLVMELVAGRPLLEVARERERSGRLELLLEVTDAVAVAHTAGVVHRDLKPANLLVGDDGHARVLDFGISSLRADAGPAGSGTPGYAAPEQIAGSRVGTRGDVFSLGALGRELLGPKLPVDLDAVLDKARAPDRSRRYADAAALADDLRRYRAAHTVMAREGVRLAWLGPMIRRHRRALVLASIAAVTAPVLVVSVLMTIRDGYVSGAQGSLELVREHAADLPDDELEQRFLSLVRFPVLQGDPTLARAWVWWASRQHGEGRLDALATAYLHADQPETSLSLVLAEAERQGVELSPTPRVHAPSLISLRERRLWERVEDLAVQGLVHQARALHLQRAWVPDRVGTAAAERAGQLGEPP